MGRNGAGKSTLLGRPGPARCGRRSGRVEVDGRAPADLAAARAGAARSGWCRRSPGDLLYAESVGGRVRAGRPGRSACPPARRRALLDRRRPGVDADLHPRDLSEGQRLALALAVVLAGARRGAARRADPRAWTTAPRSGSSRSCATWPPRAHRRARHPRRGAGGRGGRPGASCWPTARWSPTGPPATCWSSSPAFAPQVAKVAAPAAVAHRRRGRGRAGRPGACCPAVPVSAAAAGRPRAVRWRRCSRWAWSSLVGLVAFGWPFLASRAAGPAPTATTRRGCSCCCSACWPWSARRARRRRAGRQDGRGARRAGRRRRRAAGCSAPAPPGSSRCSSCHRAGRPGVRPRGRLRPRALAIVHRGAAHRRRRPVAAVPDDRRRLGRVRRRPAPPGRRPRRAWRCWRRTRWSPASPTGW